MTLRRRLALSFLAIVTLLAANQAISFWSARLRANSMRTLDRVLTREVLIASIRRELDNLHREVTLLSEIQFPEGGAGSNPEARQQFDQKLRTVAGELAQLKDLTDPSRRAGIMEVEDTYNKLAESWRSFYEYLGIEQGWALANVVRADPLAQRLLTAIVPRLENEEAQRRREAAAAFDAVTRMTNRMSVLIFALSTLAAVALAYAVSSHLARGLRELKRGTELIGAMQLDHRIALEDRDELGDLARAFNDMAGRLLIARTQLTQANQELSALNHLLGGRIEEEVAGVRVASRIQRDLLPQGGPLVPGYDIAGRSVPARAVGGDYFDFVPVAQGRLAICIGDMCGKGLPAVMLMATLHTALRGQALVDPSPGICLDRSNTLLLAGDGGRFASLFYGALDAQRHELRYSNAGHHPPLLLRPDGGCTRLDRGGLLLGVRRDGHYDEDAIPFGPADILLLYSDGLAEAPDTGGDAFGESRLVAEVRAHAAHPAEAIVERLLVAVRAHARDSRQTDDMTAVIVKRTPAA